MQKDIYKNTVFIKKEKITMHWQKESRFQDTRMTTFIKTKLKKSDEF